jgi:ribosomal-protein-alanine N-acetyltransferase
MTDLPDEVLTPRLRLRTLSLDDARLVLQGERDALAARIRASVPADWPGPGLAASLPGIVAHMAQHPADAAGWVWVVIDQQAAAMVGDIGFHSPVRSVASVEIGYLIFPDARGRGYATEAAAALLAWAFSQPEVERVTARIEPGNGPSLRVAAKLGMRETASEEPGYRCFERLKSDPCE